MQHYCTSTALWLGRSVIVQVGQQASRGSYAADRIARYVFFICALLIVVIILGVFLFVGLNAFKVFGEGANVGTFLFTSNWDPSGATTDSGQPIFGAGGLILGSLVITFFSAPLHSHSVWPSSLLNCVHRG